MTDRFDGSERRFVEPGEVRPKRRRRISGDGIFIAGVFILMFAMIGYGGWNLWHLHSTYETMAVACQVVGKTEKPRTLIYKCPKGEAFGQQVTLDEWHAVEVGGWQVLEYEKRMIDEPKWGGRRKP